MRLASGGTATALELQQQYHEWLSKYAEREHDDPVTGKVLTEWGSLLEDLEADPMSTADRLDWVAKYRLLRGFAERGVDWSDAKMRALDLQYHDVDPSRSLYQRLVGRNQVRRLFTAEEIEAATEEAPETTRAWFRGQCVRKFAGDLAAANWDSLVFDTGGEFMKRVPMMEPLRGTKELVGDLVAEADDAIDLLAALGGA